MLRQLMGPFNELDWLPVVPWEALWIIGSVAQDPDIKLYAYVVKPLRVVTPERIPPKMYDHASSLYCLIMPWSIWKH